MKKKISFLMAMLVLSVLSANTVMAATVKGCSVLGSKVQIDTKFTTITHLIILIIQIAIPIILVIFGMIDLLKGVTSQKEEEIKKGQQTFVKRLIAAAIVFFVVSIVRLVVSFVADDEDGIMKCADCFIKGTYGNGECKK